MSFREWSLGRVALLSLAWVVAVGLLRPWPRGDTIQGFTDTGEVFLSASSPPPPEDFVELGGWVLGPPLVLFAAWRLQKR